MGGPNFTIKDLIGLLPELRKLLNPGPDPALAELLIEFPELVAPGDVTAVELAEHAARLTDYRDVEVLRILEQAYRGEGLTDRADEIAAAARDMKAGTRAPPDGGGDRR